MRRLLVVVFALVGAVVAISQPVRASGGGGCGDSVTEASGTAVSIEQFCFEPTVLYVAAGDPVTWTNLDPARHDVLGSNAAWGSYEALRRNATTTNAFARPGVYPYVCTWHPGMSGAIVVGDAGLDRLEMAPISSVAKGDGHLIDTSRAGEMAAAVLGGMLLFGGLTFAHRRWGGGSAQR